MSAENKEVGNILPNIKEMIKNGNINIDQALQGLWMETQETIAFQGDLNRVWLEIQTLQVWENGQDITKDLGAIFSQYLQPKNIV